MKRVVRLRNKKTGELNTFLSVADMVRRNTKEALGITLSSIYNALCINGGRWENGTYEVYYEDIDLGKSEW